MQVVFFNNINDINFLYIAGNTKYLHICTCIEDPLVKPFWEILLKICDGQTANPIDLKIRIDSLYVIKMAGSAAASESSDRRAREASIVAGGGGYINRVHNTILYI